eukprot:EG_transcript_21551
MPPRPKKGRPLDEEGGAPDCRTDALNGAIHKWAVRLQELAERQAKCEEDHAAAAADLEARAALLQELEEEYSNICRTMEDKPGSFSSSKPHKPKTARQAALEQFWNSAPPPPGLAAEAAPNVPAETLALVRPLRDQRWQLKDEIRRLTATLAKLTSRMELLQKMAVVVEYGVTANQERLMVYQADQQQQPSPRGTTPLPGSLKGPPSTEQRSSVAGEDTYRAAVTAL